MFTLSTSQRNENPNSKEISFLTYQTPFKSRTVFTDVEVSENVLSSVSSVDCQIVHRRKMEFCYFL